MAYFLVRNVLCGPYRWSGCRGFRFLEYRCQPGLDRGRPIAGNTTRRPNRDRLVAGKKFLDERCGFSSDHRLADGRHLRHLRQSDRQPRRTGDNRRPVHLVRPTAGTPATTPVGRAFSRLAGFGRRSPVRTADAGTLHDRPKVRPTAEFRAGCRDGRVVPSRGRSNGDRNRRRRGHGLHRTLHRRADGQDPHSETGPADDHAGR